MFPVLEYMSGALRDNQKTLLNLQQSVVEIKGAVTTIRDVQEELRSLMKEFNKNSFSLKAHGYDVCLIAIIHTYSQWYNYLLDNSPNRTGHKILRITPSSCY